MHPVIKIILDGAREVLGHPVPIMRLLEEHPGIRVTLDASTSSIDAESVTAWHDLGETVGSRGMLSGWRVDGGYSYGSFNVHRPEYMQLGRCEVTNDWRCDISEIHGFSSSKSNLSAFNSTDAMVEAKSPEMIDEISPAKLAENLAHREIRIIHSPGSDSFRRHLWDGRLFLINSGGSHHLAAAKYIAARLPQEVVLRGKLETYSLNPVAVAQLRRDYEMFVISDANEISMAFHDAMERYRATWLWHHMPRPYERTRAVLLPKTEPRSMKVAALLRNAGVVDLGAHLASLASAQAARRA